MTQRDSSRFLDWITEDPMISPGGPGRAGGITRFGGAYLQPDEEATLWAGGNPAAGGYVVVAGAVNVDIGGQSAGPLVGRDSNPGKVTVSMGAVGRNIAHNLRLLGVKVSLLTGVLGEDLTPSR